MKTTRSVAIVHDWLTGMRGGEKVLEVLCDLYPEATLYTLTRRPGSCSPSIERMRIRTSLLDRLPGGRSKYQYYLPFYPALVRTLDLRGHDLVISSSHAAAKAVRVDPGAVHVSYCHTPMRYLWDQYEQYFGPGRASLPVRLAMNLVRPSLQAWDVRSARRVDAFIANSATVAGRIQRIYGRPSQVIFPPVDVERFGVSSEPGSYFLVVSALVPYKRIDLAVAAFNRLDERLIIVGSGGEERSLRSMIRGGNITLVGRASDEEIAVHYRRCKALIFPGEEDFGIVPVEAMASGKPVIAFGKGGATETVRDGVSGLFFGEQTPESLLGALEKFRVMTFDPAAIRAGTLRFGRGRFREEVRAAIEEALGGSS